VPETAQIEQIKVTVRGSELRGWISFQISRTLDAASASFEIDAVLRKPSAIKPGDEVQISFGPDVLVNGRADVVSRRLERDGLRFTVAGRDLTGDLVDCSATNDPGEWRQLDLRHLIVELCAPFDVGLEYLALLNPVVEHFKLRPGETAWSAIERACRMNGVLIFGSREGGLTVRDPGRDYATVDLIEGQNVIEAEFTADDSERYRLYRVTGQHPGSDLTFGETVALVEGESVDLGGRDKRVLVVIAETAVTNQTAAERAQWEAIVRAARAVRLRVEVSGVRQLPGGSVWDLNQKVNCQLPSLNCEQFLLLRAISITGSREGVHSSLELCRDDAYRADPTLKKEKDPIFLWGSESDEFDAEPDDETSDE
jgi:prophage tail gpP-like protein